MVVFFEWLRRTSFWTLDAMKGGSIHKHYKDIQIVLDKPESDRSKEIRGVNLQNILEHATSTVPYYEKIDKPLIDLSEFPIVDKQKIRDNFDRFRSRAFSERPNHKVTTSGSTGIPFSIYQDRRKRERNTADTYFFAEKAGFKLGSKLFYLRLWDKQYKKQKLLTLMQNISSYSVDELSEENLTKLVGELKNGRTGKSILGYTSAIDTLCAHIEQNYLIPLDCKIDSIIGMAESLSPALRERVLKCFGKHPVSRYSNSENGILAQQLPDSSTDLFEINWASYHFEILDLNEDRPVEYGEPGRIVITDLYNYAMPMIRYDTGDVGTMEYDRKRDRVVLTKIEGRKMDMFTNTKGELVSSHIVHLMLQFRGIDQFQFVENEKGEYIIKMKISDEFDKKDENVIRSQYAEYFGEDAIIRIEYVDEIPLLPSGKRKLVINKRREMALARAIEKNQSQNCENAF